MNWKIAMRIVPSVILIVLALLRMYSSDIISDRMDQTFLLLIALAVLIPLVPWERLTTFKAVGIELVLERTQVKGAVDSIMGLDRIENESIRRQLGALKEELQHFQGSRILWIDDRPESIIAERRLFRSLGAEVVPVISSEEAEEIIFRDIDFDLIISDVQRLGESYKFNNGEPIHEGVNFIVKLRSQSEPVIGTLPVLFYAAYDWERLVRFTKPARETNPEPELSNSMDMLLTKAIKKIAELRECPIKVTKKQEDSKRATSPRNTEP